MDIEEIAIAAALHALEPDWAALFARCPHASPFQSPAWMLAWVDAFRPRELWVLARSRRFVCVDEEGGEPHQPAAIAQRQHP